MNRNAIRSTETGYELTLTTEQIKTGHLEVPPGIRQLIRTQARAVQKPQQVILEGARGRAPSMTSRSFSTFSTWTRPTHWMR